MSNLHFTASIDAAKFNKTLDDIEKRIKGIQDNGNTSEPWFSAAKIVEASEVIGVLKEVAGSIIKVRGEFQQLEVSFGAMLKSKAEANAIMQDVVQMAAQSPFEFSSIAEGAKQLIIFGANAQTATNDLKMLGDIAVGTGMPINDLAAAYGAMRQEGEASKDQLETLASKGIPIYAELGKILKISTDDVKYFAEAGRIGFGQIEQAFVSMTSNGGMFDGLMKQQSETLQGALTQLSNAFGNMFNGLAQDQEGFIVSVISGAADLVNNYEKIIDVLTVLLATYGSYKTVILAVNALNELENKTMSQVADAIHEESGTIAKQIALKVKDTEATASLTAATAAESKAKAENAVATTTALRAEVSALAVKKQAAAQTLKAATAEVSASKAKLAAAQQELAANATAINAKRVEEAQNALLIASENRLAARKLASASAAELKAASSALEAAAKNADTLALNANSAATLANNAATNASAVAGTRVNAIKALQIAITSQLTAAQTAFNATLLANPIVLFTVSIAALAGAMWYLHDSTTAAEKAQKRLDETMDDLAKKKQEMVSKTQSLVGAINNETNTKVEQARAFAELKRLYPSLLGAIDLETFKKKDATQAQLELNKAVDDFEVASLQKQFEQASEKADTLGKQYEGLRANLSAGVTSYYIAKLKDDFENATKEAEAYKKQLAEIQLLHYKANTPYSEQLKKLAATKIALEANKKELESTLPPFVSAKKETSVLDEILRRMSLQNLINDINKADKDIKELKDKMQEGDADFGLKLTNATLKKDVNGLVDLKKLATTENKVKDLADAVRLVKATLKMGSAEHKQLEALSKSLASVGKGEKAAPMGSIGYYDKVLAKIKDAIGLITNPDSKQAKDLLASKVEAEQKLAGLREKLEKDYADGSIDYYRKRAADAATELSKIEPGNEGRIAELKNIQAEATKKAAQLAAQYEVKTVEQSLEEKKTQYELYNRWVTYAGKEAADAQFKDLLQSGESYEKYIESKIGEIKAKQTSGTASTTDLENLVAYQFTLESVSQSFEKYKQQITAAGEQTGTMTEKLALLKQEQEKIGKADPQKAGFIAEQIVETEKKRKDLIKSFLTENNLNEEKRLAIQKKYDDLRAGLDQEYADKKSSVYQEALNKINLQEQNALNEADGYFKGIAEKAQKELSAIGENKNQGKLKQFLSEANTDLTEMQIAGQTGTEAYKQLEKAIEDAKKKLAEIDVENTREVFNILGQIGQELSNADGNLGKFGKSLAEAAKQANLVFTAVKEGAKTSEIITSVTGLVLNLISKIINQRKEEQRMRLADIKAMNEYNLLLTERIRLQSIANSNGFTKNYEGQINDTAAALAKATTDYSNAMQAMKNAKGPQLAGKSFFGIWGKAVFAPNLTQRVPDLINAAGELNVELAKSLINSEALTDEEKVLLDNAIKTTEALEKVREQGKSIIQDLVGQIANNLRNALVDAFKSGTSAAEAFGKSVAEIMADVASKLMFDKIMQPVFNRLAEEIDHSLYAPGGDRNVLDDFERYQDYGLEAANAYVEGQKYIQEMVKNATGIDPYADIKDKESNTLSGSIKSITEETAGVLAGQMNAIRVTQATNLEVNRSQLLALNKIATNSEFLQHLEILKSIDKKLSSGDDSRSWGAVN